MLLHLQGRIDRSTERAWESFAVTEDDFIHYGDVARRLPVSLAARLRRTHLLLLGYTLSTWTLRVVLERLWGSEPLPYRSWSVHPGRSRSSGSSGGERDVEVVDMAPAAYVAELERALEKAAAHGDRRSREPVQGPRRVRRLRARRAPLLRPRARDRGGRGERAREPADRPLRARAASARARSSAPASPGGCAS